VDGHGGLVPARRHLLERDGLRLARLRLGLAAPERHVLAVVDGLARARLDRLWPAHDQLRLEVVLEPFVRRERVDRRVELTADDLGLHGQLAAVLLPHVLADELPPEPLPPGPANPLHGPPRLHVGRPRERPPETDAPPSEDRLLGVALEELL